MRGYQLLPAVVGVQHLSELRMAAERALDLARTAARHPDAPTTVWPDGHRLTRITGAMVHWEPGVEPDTVRSVSPFTHLDPLFGALWHMPAITDAVARFVGTADLGEFTCKFNVKRAGVGSAFPWHQDYTYWYCCAGFSASDIATAMIFLDDVDAGNGALRVVPGSHRSGPAPRDRGESTGLYVDTARVPVDGAVTVEAPAGSVLVFPGMLVHGSPPNLSATDRRCLLLCFQPAGRPRLADLPFQPHLLTELP